MRGGRTEPRKVSKSTYNAHASVRQTGQIIDPITFIERHAHLQQTIPSTSMSASSHISQPAHPSSSRQAENAILDIQEDMEMGVEVEEEGHEESDEDIYEPTNDALLVLADEIDCNNIFDPGPELEVDDRVSVHIITTMLLLI